MCRANRVGSNDSNGRVTPEGCAAVICPGGMISRSLAKNGDMKGIEPTHVYDWIEHGMAVLTKQRGRFKEEVLARKKAFSIIVTTLRGP